MSRKPSREIYKEYTDEQLVQASCRGETRAFDELVIRYSRKLYLLLLQYSRNETIAYDAAQNAFVKAYQSLKKLKEEAKFFSWIYRIGINEAVDLLKKFPPNTISVNEERNDDEKRPPIDIVDPNPTTDPSRGPDEHILAEALKKAINNLSEPLRLVVVHCNVLGEKPEEVAKLLGIPHGTLRSRLHNAHQKLQKELDAVKHLMHR